MATLRIRAETANRRRVPVVDASDAAQGAHLLRYGDERARWEWTIRGSTYSRGDLLRLLQLQELGALGAAEWDWTPPIPAGAAPVKVRALSVLPFSLDGFAANAAEFRILELLSTDT